MEFRQCSIMGQKYLEKNDTLMMAMDNDVFNLQRIESFTVRTLIDLYHSYHL